MPSKFYEFRNFRSSSFRCAWSLIDWTRGNRNRTRQSTLCFCEFRWFSDYVISLWSSLPSSTQRWMTANRKNRNPFYACRTRCERRIRVGSRSANVPLSPHPIICYAMRWCRILVWQILSNVRSKLIVLVHLYACEYLVASPQWGARMAQTNGQWTRYTQRVHVPHILFVFYAHIQA